MSVCKLFTLVSATDHSVALVTISMYQGNDFVVIYIKKVMNSCDPKTVFIFS